MRWSAVRAALAHLYFRDGRPRRSMQKFATEAGVSPRTVRRILNDPDDEASIEWNTLEGWLRVTVGGTVTEFLATFDEPLAPRRTLTLDQYMQGSLSKTTLVRPTSAVEVVDAQAMEKFATAINQMTQALTTSLEKLRRADAEIVTIHHHGTLPASPKGRDTRESKSKPPARIMR